MTNHETTDHLPNARVKKNRTRKLRYSCHQQIRQDLEELTDIEDEPVIGFVPATSDEVLV